MKPIAAFVAAAYALSIALSLMIGLTGGYDSSLIGIRYLSMFLSALAVLVSAATMHEVPRIHWDRFPLTYLPLALFLIPGVLHMAMLPLFFRLEGRWQWQDWLTPQADGLYQTRPREDGAR